MHFSSALLPPWLLYLGGAAALAALGVALRRAHWRALRAAPARVHLVAGGAVACLLLWLLNVHIVDGVVLHFLGMTTFTLVAGWSFSVLAGAVAVLFFALVEGPDWAALPLSLCTTVVVPALVTRLLAFVLRRYGLRNPFAYFLGAGFAGGALVVAVLAVVGVGLLALGDNGDTVSAALATWPLLALLMFAEGFINGMCVSALAVFYPQGVKTFDDRFYFDGEG